MDKIDELLKAIDKLTEEVKKLQAARTVEHHYHYMAPQPLYVYGPNGTQFPQWPTPSPYYVTTMVDGVARTHAGITAQPAT